VFHDLEKNSGLTSEVKRRITNREGKRFSADMITVTANAASSIALRNAIFRGIPKALWISVELEVRKVIAGDAKTMGVRRETVVGLLNKMGVTNEQIFAVLDVHGMSDIGMDEIVTLNGLGNAIREGEMSIEEAFAPEKQVQVATHTQGAKEALKARQGKTEPAKTDKPTETNQPTTNLNNPLMTPAEREAHTANLAAAIDKQKQQNQEQLALAAQKEQDKLDAQRKPGGAPADIPWEKQAEPEPQPKTDPKPKTQQEWAEALKAASKRGRNALDEVWDLCIAAHEAANAEMHLDLEALIQLLYKRTS
jgi:hypothetical protein